MPAFDFPLTASESGQCRRKPRPY